MAKKILLSRTDNLGDVILTLPMAGVLKGQDPSVEIFFLGKHYTKSIIESCQYVDHFVNWSELEQQDNEWISDYFNKLNLNAFVHVFPQRRIAKVAAKAKVPMRIGTSHRWYHLLSCTHKPAFTRKKSPLHEAELNIRLLKDLGITNIPLSKDLHNYFGLKKPAPDPELEQYLDPERFNLILHPLSHGSAQEWGQQRFCELIAQLDPEKWNVIITGTKQEGELLFDEILFPHRHRIKDTTGKFTLPQLMNLIAHADGLLAASTGPLHIAASFGIHALGLYSCRRPIHAGRWKPLGQKAQYLETNDPDALLSSISVQQVLAHIMSWSK